MVMVVIVVTALSVLVVSMLSSAADGSRWTKTDHDVQRAQAVAESAAVLAANQLWSDFQGVVGADSSPRITDFQAFLDGRGITEGDASGAGTLTELLGNANLPRNEDGTVLLDGVEIDRLVVSRFDDLNSTRLEVSASATARLGRTGSTSRAITEHVQQTFVIEPPDWEGLNYALLANNINCLMCHTQVDNVERFYNQDSERFGTHRRVKLGSLESIHLRSDPESWFAGSLYLGGPAVDEHGESITAWGGLNFKSREFDQNGYLIEDQWGDLAQTNLSPAHPTTPLAGENLYLNYFENGIEGMVDGILPEEFPAPFPDDGGFDPVTRQATPELADNRILDDNEFMSAVGKARGTLSGGSIGIATGQVTTEAQLATLTSGGTQSLDSITDGNVYLHGTQDNPIRLNGDVAVNGDLIVSGYVEGRGSLSVSGNVYVPSDLVYADGQTDGSRSFGASASGSPNVLSVAAGGNVVVGDPYHPAWGSGNPANGFSDGSFNFLMEEIGIFNRVEWMKTQPTLPGEPERKFVETKTWQEEVEETETVAWTVEEPVYEWVVIGTREKPVYDTVVVGQREEPVYETVVVEDRPAEYGGPITERRQIGTRTVDVTERVQVGTRTVDRKEKRQVGTRTVEKSEERGTGVFRTVERSRDIYEWVTPEIPNPNYQGADFIPRYYNFAEGSPVIAFNKEGHFDGNLWLGDERAGGWDTDKLTVADPNDPTDPLLFEQGNPKAVVSSITPSGGWINDDVFRGLITSQQATRDPDKPFEVDGTLYSANSIFGVIPNRNAPGMNGRLLVNGAVVAADVGLLAPEGTQLNYDARGRQLLTIRSATRLGIRRQLFAPPVPQ